MALLGINLESIAPFFLSERTIMPRRQANNIIRSVRITKVFIRLATAAGFQSYLCVLYTCSAQIFCLNAPFRARIIWVLSVM